jgi:tRNA A-37 threonylcarbamoyl transferase component Bud32
MTPVSAVPTSKLRNALRLVHCIQKERGSSCAFYAANTNTVFESAMLEARTASDSSVQLMMTTVPLKGHGHRRNAESDLPVASSLRKIRRLIDGSSGRAESRNPNPQDPSNHDLIFHRIFVCFNTLISSIVHECILKDLGGCDAVTSEGTTMVTPKPTVGKRQRRGLTTDIDDKHCTTLNPAVATTPERQSGNGDSVAPLDSGAASSTTLQMESSSDGGRAQCVETTDRGILIDSVPLQSPVSLTQTPPPPSGGGAKTGRSARQQLLDLLHLFVRLKESAGVERAILSSLLAFRNHGTASALPSLRMLTNDLILEVENQRALYHQLERLPSGHHHALVLEQAQLSPRLMDLHQIILTDFASLEGLEYDSETIWDLITLYIDKLHSVELLIIEDLECSMPASETPPEEAPLSTELDETPCSSSSSSAASNLLDAVLEKLVSASVDSEERKHVLLAEVENMSADALKKRVKELIRSGWNTLTGTTSSAESYNHQSQLCTEVSTGSHTSLSRHSQAESHASSTDSPAGETKEGWKGPQFADGTTSTEWDISIYEINFTKRIGQGASATTYLGEWTNQKVAVKVASLTEFGLEGWRTEVNSLRRLHHPNVIRLMGSIYNESPPTHCLVLEYCNAGDLATALRYPTPPNFFVHVSSSIANAMSYLHKRGIMHRDLKPANVLCDGNIASGNFVVKITDFGIATEIARSQPRSDGAPTSTSTLTGIGQPEQRTLTGETGTYRWMSPEVIRHENYSAMADVYSYSVMLWQFLTHEEPFCDVGAVEAARLTALEGERPPMPKQTPEPVGDMIRSNWSDDPHERWEFSRIVERLQQLDVLLSVDEISWLEEPHGHPVYAHEDGMGVVDSSAQLRAGGRRRATKQNKSETKQRSGKGSPSPGRKSSSGRGRSPGRRTNLLSSFFGHRKKGSSDTLND